MIWHGCAVASLAKMVRSGFVARDDASEGLLGQRRRRSGRAGAARPACCSGRCRGRAGRGTTGAAGRTTAAACALARQPGHSADGAARAVLPSIVARQRRQTSAAEQLARCGSSTSSRWRTAPPARIASSEWPPSSKKLSLRRPRSSAVAAARPRSRPARFSVGVARRDVVARLRPARVRRRQRLAVDLAVRRQRQALQHHDSAGHHVVRQRAARSCARKFGRVGVRAAPRGDHVGHQALVARAVLARQHHRLAHAGVLRQQRSSISPSSMRKPRILTW